MNENRTAYYLTFFLNIALNFYIILMFVTQMNTIAGEYLHCMLFGELVNRKIMMRYYF